jgi:hypothetical protein
MSPCRVSSTTRVRARPASRQPATCALWILCADAVFCVAVHGDLALTGDGADQVCGPCFGEARLFVTARRAQGVHLELEERRARCTPCRCEHRAAKAGL